MKDFLRLIKYELKRVTRNRFIMSMLLCFSLIILSVLAFVNVESINYPLAVNLDGQRLEDLDVIDLLYEDIEDMNVIYVESSEEGLKLLRNGKVCFFIDVHADTTPVTATFYYDGASASGRTIRNLMLNKANEYTYQTTTEFLADFGITINKDYFHAVTFLSGTKEEVTVKQVPFALEVACVVSIILMFGLAYSMSRDNETKISKNIAYMPIGIHKYLWSKIIPYFILGILEITLIYVLGSLAFDITFYTNIFAMIGISSVFVLAVIMAGLLFSCSKSQIATIFLDMGVILIPVFAVMMTFLQTLYLPFKIVIYSMPITAFTELLNGMMYSGVIIWSNVLILLLLCVLFYLITVYVLNRRVAKCKF